MLPDDNVREDGDPGTDRCPLPHHSGFDLPILLRLNLARWSGGSGVGIVDKGHVVSDKHMVFNYHTFANERMAGNLAPFPDLRVLLNFNKSANLRLITDLATIKIDEPGKLDVLPQPHVLSYTDVFIH